ncbi:distal tail protein [Aeromonas phage vB_AdhS_TS3]|nr:distal tail protein [Aeromonas phage vB_AdhS_TS3]
MQLPDPINNPGAPGFSSSDLQSVQPILQDSMPNTKVLTVTSGEQYWKLNLGYPDMLVSEFNILN